MRRAMRDGLETRVHVYLAAGPDSLAVLSAGHRVLDAEERERAARFHFAADRETYRAAHVLLRRSLSRHVPIEPADWRFVRTPLGRPEVDREACPAAVGLRFNLAHTRGLVCCAVTRDAPVGVDAEQHRPLDDALYLAERLFAPAEVAALAAAPREGRVATFHAYWTLKEAYLKATGLGLSAGLDRFAFRLDGARPATIALNLDPTLEEGAGDWRFVLLRVGDGHTLAVGVRAGEGAVLRVHRPSPDGAFADPRVVARSPCARVEWE
jgi:4'-phosphopantetheinyl transferase